MGGVSSRTLWIWGGIVSLFLFVGTKSGPQYSGQIWRQAKSSVADSTSEWWTGSTTTLELVEDPEDEAWVNSIEEKCSPADVVVLSRPGFWIANELSPFQYIISPRNSSHLIDPSCLDSAIFATRIVSKASSSDPIISSLVSPTLSNKIAGVYSFGVDVEQVVPRRAYNVEVRLEFGRLPGAREGTVCGTQSTCDVSVVHPESHFVGKMVEVLSGSQIVIGREPESLSRASEEICQSISPLSGYWEGPKFFPSVASQPCRLQQPSPFSPADPSPLWIHLVGDSNIRNLYGALVGSFGKGDIVSHDVTDSTVRNGTFASVALRSSSRRSGAAPNVILTWTWWESKSQDFHSNAKELDHWTSGMFSDFLDRASLPSDSLSGHPELERAADRLRPTRTYFSLGSHSEDLTAYGTSELLDVLLSEAHMSQQRRADVNARIFTTTFVQSAKIPLNKFPHQDIVRNNAMIRGKNDVLRTRKELAGRVIDAEGLTDGITESYMKYANKMDAVHFDRRVYLAWTELVWTDLLNQGLVP